jgi:hypothetical protein
MISSGSGIRPGPLPSPTARTFGRLENLVAERPRVRDVALCLRVRPHPVVHRRYQQNLRRCREQASGKQIIGETVCRPADEVRRRWRDDNHVRFAGEADMIERVSRSEDLCVHRTSGDRFECDGADELAGAASHDDVDLSSRLCKQTRQPH